MGDGIRRNRVAGAIRKHLSSELAREVKDPRLSALAIEKVDVTGDLGSAKVYVRLMFGDDEPSARAEVMRVLTRLAPGLRSSLSAVLRVRRIPELKFVYDEGADHRARIDAVLTEIQQEEQEREARTLGSERSSNDED